MLSKFLGGITTQLWGLFRRPPPKEKYLNVAVQKPLGPKTADRYRGFRFAKSAVGALLLTLFGLSPAVQAAAALDVTMLSILQVDANSDGIANPGDTVRYQIDIENTGDAADTSVVFTITPDTKTTLQVSTVTTTPQGSVTTGNGAGDTTVAVNVGSILAGVIVRIEFDVVVDTGLSTCETSVSAQGTVTSTTYPGGKVTDDINNAQTDEATIRGIVVATNNPPTSADNTVSTYENTQKVFASSDFPFTDIDCSNNTLSQIQITSLESVGDLYYDANDNGANDAEDVSVNDVIAVTDILRLKFEPVLNASGAAYDTFQFKVQDGADYSASAYTMTINVDANNAPTAADNTVTTNEDTAYPFVEADFGYADADSEPLVSVEITTLETVGALQLSGVDVTLNEVIAVADITAGNLTFAPAADANGTGYDTFQFTVNDGKTDSLAAYTMTIDVTAVADDPTAADNTVTTNEDTTYTFGTGDFSFSDVDSDTLASVKITTLETVGALQLSGVDVALNDVIVVADITGNLLTFAPVADGNGTGYDNFQFTVIDSTAAESASANTMTIDVTAVQDVPTATDNTVTGTEDTDYVFAAADFNFVDVDGESLVSVEITTLETVGALKLSSVDVALNDVIAVADITAGNLTFTPVANASGTGYDSFGFTVNDGTADSTPANTMTIDINAANDPPTAADATVTATEDTTYTFAAGDFNASYTDPEGDAFASIEITALETVGILQVGGVDVALNEVITVANIPTLTFDPVANASGTGYDSFQFMVNDGTNNSVSAYTMMIDVNAVNDAPTGADNTVTTDEDVDYTFVAADFGFSDVDGNTLASVEITTLETVGSLELSTVAVTLNQVITVADINAFNLKFVPVADASGTGYDNFGFTVNDGAADSAAYTMTIDVTAVNDPPTSTDNTATASEDVAYAFVTGDFPFTDNDGGALASVQITTLETVGTLQISGVDVALNDVIAVADITGSNLTFTSAADGNGPSYDSFGFTVNDGTDDSVAAYTMTINVTAVNDIPTVTADPTVTTNEDTTFTFTGETDFNYYDGDGDPFTSIQITTLETVGALQLSGVDVTSNEVITAANITAGNLTFDPVANGNGTGYDSFGFTVNDGTADSTPANTMTIDVTAVNDLPTAADNTVTTNEDTAYPFTAADFGFSDVDGDSLVSVEITIIETVGTLQLSGADVTANQVITVADITASNLTFTPVANASGTGYDSFQFTVNDGTADSASAYTMTIDVTAVNDPPTAADNTVTTNEDTTYTFADSDFGYSDAEGDAFTSVEITTLETVGTLQISGVDVVLNEVITVANIPNLTFDPVAGANGAAYDTFQFTVNDGTQDSTAAYTMTIDVTPVNDPPTAADFTITVNEDASNTFASGNFGFNDVDGDSLVSIEITQLPVLGSLELSSVAVTPNQVILVANIPNLVYAPAANGSGTSYDNFQFTVNDGAADSSPANTVTVDVNAVNDAPSFDDSLGNTTLDNTPTFVEDSSAVVLDADATISDPELDAANDYNGATLTLVRTGGTANADDEFSETGTLSALTEGGALTVSGIGIGTVTTNSGGTLLLTFGAGATGVLVNSALQQIAYSNSNNGPPASVQIDYTIDDGNTGTQGTGTPLNGTGTGSITVTIIGVNDAPINVVPGTQTIDEDATLTFSTTAPSNVISVSDVDAGTNHVKVYLTADQGTLTLNGVTNLAFLIGDGTDDASMTFTGPMSDINVALDGMVFTPDADFNGTAGACDGVNACVQIVTNDQGNTGGSSASIDDDTVAIDVTPVNDDPAFTSTAITSVDEDVLYSYSVVASDVDTGDTLTITAPTIPAWLALTATGGGTETLSGTPADADVGTHNVTLRVNDGTVDVDQSFTITVNAVNDAPVNNLASAAETMAEDTTLTFTGANLISISDDAGANEVQVTLTATSTLTLSGVAGLTFSVGDGTADSNMAFTGTTTDINTALDGMVYTPTADYNGPGSVQIVTNDQGYTGGGALSDDDTVSITITAVNDAPMFTSTPAVTTVDEDSAFSYSVVTTDVDVNAVTITDPTTATWLTLVDNGDGTGTLSGIPTNDDVGTHNITLQVSDGTLTADQTFTVTVVNVNDAPVFTSTAVTAIDEDSAYSYSVVATDVDVGDSLTITAPTIPGWLSLTTGGGGTETLSGTPTNSEVGTHNVTLRVNDGTVDVDQSFTITVANVNDAPVLDNTLDKDGNTADLSLAAIDEDAGAPSGAVGTLMTDLVALAGNVTDVDSGAVTGVALTDALTTDGSWHYTLDAGTTWIAVGSVADNNALLLAADANTRLYFEPNADFNGTITDAITLRAWDQDSGTAGALVDTSVNGGITAFSSATDTANLTVTAVNDAPIFTSTEVTSVDEDVLYSYSIVTTDVDGDALTITAPTTATWLTLVDNTDGTATFSGTPTDSEVGDHSVTLRVNDGTVDVDQSFTITVNPVNDAPVNGVPGAQTMDEDTTLTFTGANLISISDDAGASDLVQVTLMATSTLTLSGTTNLTFTVGDGTDDTNMAFTGTMTDINAALDGMSYSPTADYFGAGAIRIVTNDQGYTGGGALSDDDIVNITINPVNDAPVFTSTAVTTIDEDSAYTYSIATSDVDGDALTITAPTTVAWLTLVDNADGTGTLSGTPTNAEVGTHNVTLRVNDGTVDVDQSFTITVNPVNDAPVNSVPSAQSVDEDTTLTFNAANTNLISISDVDAASSLVAVTLTATNGVLTLSGTTGLTITAPSDGTDDASMAFTGTITDINTALDGMIFTPTAGYNGAASVQIVTSDEGNTGSGGALSDDDTLNITVNAVNDAPVNTVPAAQTMDEDTALAFTGANLISISDVDAGTMPVQMSLTATDGTLTLSGTTGLAFILGDGTDDANLIFSGALTDVNVALDGMSFSPTTDYNGTASVQIVTNDLGSTGSGGALSADDTVSITVNAVNDAPVNTVPGALTIDEDTALSFTGANLISISDDAGTNSVEVTLAATEGTLTLTGTTGLAFTTGTGTNEASMVFTGALTDINTALDGMSFSPTAEYSGAASVQVVTNDQGNTGSGGVLSDDDTVSITINAVNDAPINTVPTAQTIDEDTALAFTGASLIAISDDAGVNPVQVTLTAFNGLLTLNGTTGLTFTTGTGSAEASMAFTGTLTDINTALDGISFNPTANYSGPASVRIVTDDQGHIGSGGALSDDDTVSITVNAVNDPPIFTSFAVTSVSEDSAYSYSIATSDVDVGDTLTLTASTKPDWMSFTGNSNGTGTLTGTPTNSEVGTHEVTLQVSDGIASPVDQTFTVTVFNTNDAPAFTSTAVTSVNEDSAYSYSITTSDVDVGDTLTLTASTKPDWLTLADSGDGTGTGTLSGTPVKSDVGTHDVTLQVSDGSVQVDQSFTVTVINVNEAPVFTSTPVTAVDVDSVYNYSIATGDVDGDALTISAPVVPSWVTFADNGDGTGVLSGTATEAVLGPHEVTLQVSDGVLQAEQSFTVTVSIPNKAPVNTVPDAQTVGQESALIFSTTDSNLIAISDEDAGVNAVEVTLTATNMTCTLSGVAGLTFTAGDGTDDAIMAFTGMIADINAALEGMSCSPTAGFSGEASVQIVTNDLGNTGSGGPQSDDDTVIINVSPVPLELTLTLDQTSFSEALGTPSTTATVSRLDASGILTVTLESSDESEATVPATVVIPDAQKSVSFSIRAVDDTEVDGTQTVTLTASASGYESDTATISVTDDDIDEQPPVDDLMTLIVTVAGNGAITGPSIDCPTDCSDAYSSNTQITLTATPVTGGQFVGWEGDCDSTNNVITVSMTTNKDCTAKFTQVAQQFALTVEKDGQGTITSDPVGIDCGEDCAANYNSGTEVTLVATPATGWLFEAWDADLCDIDEAGKVTMTAAKTCKATFVQTLVALTVEIVGKGTVTSDPEGIDCGEDCSKDFGSGTEVTLTPTPETGWQFNGWKGDQCDVDSTGKVTLATDQDCKAHFVTLSFLGGLALDAKGQLVNSESRFTNNISIGGKERANNIALFKSEAKAIKLSGMITAAPEDVGKLADILVVARYRTLLQGDVFYARDGQNWIDWDGQISLLPSAKTVTQLPETTIDVPVLEDNLSGMPGEFTVFIGYRLENGTIHYNGVEPLHFSIGNAASIDMRNHSELCFTCNEAQATDYFEGFVRNKGVTGNNLAFTDNGVFEVASKVRVDSRLMGQSADIFITATYQSPVADFPAISWTRNGNEWQNWDGQLDNLATAESYTELPETINVPVYKGQLKEFLGEFTITVGYRLDDGTLVFNMDPIHFIVE